MNLQEKALSIIEMLCAFEAESANEHTTEKYKELLDQIYRLAHSGLNHCENKHLDWKKELQDTYKHMKKEKII